MLLFMMDIDNFKSINDAYGHIEGDGALKAFSDAMKDVAIRYSAFIARYGGDEFCMVMDASGKLAGDCGGGCSAEPAEYLHKMPGCGRFL
jgi:diguanylate cyclase (GGDEF)-like protein